MQNTNSEYGSGYLVVCHFTSIYVLPEFVLLKSVCVFKKIEKLLPIIV